MTDTEAETISDTEAGPLRALRAFFFDLNGTLSDDEGVLFEIFSGLLAELGHPITRDFYVHELAGHGDVGVYEKVFGTREGFDYFSTERVARYIDQADGSTISLATREAVRFAASQRPVGVISGACGAEVEAVLRPAGIRDCVFTIVGVDRVANTKPDPESYLIALRELGALIGDVAADEVVTIEDTAPGIASAKAAGLRCLGITGTSPLERLAGADAVIDRIDRALIERLLAGEVS